MYGACAADVPRKGELNETEPVTAVSGTVNTRNKKRLPLKSMISDRRNKGEKGSNTPRAVRVPGWGYLGRASDTGSLSPCLRRGKKVVLTAAGWEQSPDEE